MISPAGTYSSCYDAADRLNSTTDTAIGTPTYDAHGNTLTIAGQTLTWDQTGRDTSITQGGVPVSYLRDTESRIRYRVGDGDDYRFGFEAPGDNPAFQRNTAVPASSVWADHPRPDRCRQELSDCVRLALTAEVGDDGAADVFAGFEVVEDVADFRQCCGAADVALDPSLGCHVDQLAHVLHRSHR